ncbi:MAG: hypothetical protein DI529_14255 [Chryseobacterium sp.]|nr:MAG: hypothetical protein DI529_14255 [Chryseobacterium sp.]
MKNIMKLSFLIGALLISTSFSAKEGVFSISLGDVTAKTLHFEVSNAQNVSLYLYDDKKGEIYSENIGNKELVEKSYDLSNLTEGNYYLVAESPIKIEKYKVTIGKGGEIIADKTPVSAINKPEFTINKNVVKLKMSNVVGDGKVSIYDTANNTYYNEENVAKNGLVDLTFDLNPANPETYIINVEKDGDSFSRMISLK